MQSGASYAGRLPGLREVEDEDISDEEPPPPPDEDEPEGAGAARPPPPPPFEQCRQPVDLGVHASNPAVVALVQEDVRLQGAVKCYNTANGFGFIKCKRTLDVFGCDVFFYKSEIPGPGSDPLEPGTHVHFSLHLRKDGKPQARRIAVGELGETYREATSVRTYCGFIKSFHPENGFGFISCEALQAAYGRDAFLHVRQKRDFGVGSRVRFQIDIDPKGYPKARDLEEISPGDEAAAGGCALGSAKRTISPGGTVRVTAEEPASSSTCSTTCEAEGDLHLELGGAAECPDCAPADQQLPESPSADAAQSDTAAADVAGGPLGAPPARSPPMPKAVWQRFTDEGGRGCWWWREEDSNWFLEAEPGSWQKFVDPKSQEIYWWRDDATWFWESTGAC